MFAQHGHPTFTVINIPRFGPFLGLDMKKDPSFSAFWKVSLGLENSAWIRRWKLATFGGFGGRSPPRKFCQKWSIFPWKKCCGFRWLSSGKTSKKLGGFGGRSPPRKFCGKMEHFLRKNAKNVTHSDEVHREKLMNVMKLPYVELPNSRSTFAFKTRLYFDANIVISRAKRMLLLQPCYSHVNHKEIWR